jgi:molecular chaperone GrpE
VSDPDAGERTDAAERDVENPDDAAEAVEADLRQLAGERDEFRALAQQVQADFENYRKRMVREQTAQIERANEGLVEQLLPALDSLEAAIAQLGDEGNDNVRKGLELVHSEVFAVLQKAGLERIDAHGQPFDPNEHEAVIQEPGEGGEPTVSGIMRTGYRLKGRVLRPAMVKVAG